MNRYQPKVSIVIPAFNASNYLSVAIDSALEQTYPNIEIIVVNDGSKDDGATAEVARCYGDKIRYFEKENGGSSSALNYGIQKMTGEWFSWLSHDDVYYPEKVAVEIDYINRMNLNPDDKGELQRHLFFAAADIIDGGGKIVCKETQKRIAETDRFINREDSAVFLIAKPTQDGFHGCTCLIHRQAFVQNGLFDETLRLLNDMDMWFRFYAQGYRVHFIPQALVQGRVHASQVSRSIGFSYHNAEQDMFWHRSFLWLQEQYPDRYDLFYLFGKTALQKTRFQEGKAAFAMAGKIKPNRKAGLWFRALYFKTYALLRALAKKVYLNWKA